MKQYHASVSSEYHRRQTVLMDEPSSPATDEKDQQQPEREEEEEESELERKEKAYLDRLPFTLQNARDSVNEMHRLLSSDAEQQFVKQMDELAAIESGEDNRDALFSKMLATLKMLSQVRRLAMKPYENDLVKIEVAAMQPGDDLLQMKENKFRYLIGQHTRKDKELRESVWDMYASVAKRVFGVTLQKAEDFLTDDRAIGEWANTG